jgi:hypothetical protein
MDPQTKALRAVLLERDRLREKMRANDRALTAALHGWSNSRPGERGGVATEAGARFILRQCGLLPSLPSREIAEGDLGAE